VSRLRRRDVSRSPEAGAGSSNSRANISRSLAAVNFFLGLVGIVQLTRIGMHESAKKDSNNTVADVVEDVKQDVKDVVKS